MKNFRHSISKLVALCAIFIFLAAPGFIHAQTSQERCSKFVKMFNINLSNGGGGSLVTDVPKFCSIGDLLSYGINLLLTFAGVVAVLFIIIGGFNYLASAGNEEQAENGKKILINSVIGLVVIIMAGAIVRIVVNTLQGDFSATNTAVPAGGGGNSGGGGTQDGGGQAGGGQVNVEYSRFIGSLPTSARIGDTISVSFIAQLGVSEMEALKKNLTDRCGSSPKLTLSLSGQPSVEESFSINPTSMAATASVKVAGEPGDRSLSVSICGMTVKQQNVAVQDEASANPGGIPAQPRYSDSDALGAAERSGFTLDINSDQLVISISASPDDIKYMCDATGTIDQYISVYNGSTGQTEKLSKTVRYVTIDIEEGDPIPSNVGVRICGYEIGQR